MRSIHPSYSPLTLGLLSGKATTYHPKLLRALPEHLMVMYSTNRETKELFEVGNITAPSSVLVFFVKVQFSDFRQNKYFQFLSFDDLKNENSYLT